MTIVSKIDFNKYHDYWTTWLWCKSHGTILGHFKTRDQAYIAVKYATKRIIRKGEL